MDDTLKINNDLITHYLGDKLSENSTVHMNVDTDYIMISEDKLINILEKHNRRGVDWFAPLGIFATLIVTLLFCDAKTVFGIAANDIHTLLVAATGMCFMWLGWAIYRAVKYRGNDDPAEMLKEIKRNRHDPVKSEV